LTVKAYAEVWGTDNTGLEYVPVAWVCSSYFFVRLKC